MLQSPFGTWPSPISADVIAAGGIRLGSVAVDATDIYWLEGRPAEAGRNVLVRRSRDGTITDLTPPGFNVRTRVHEYGGGAYVVSGGEVYFSNFADQRIYKIGGSTQQNAPYAITPAGDWFYADATVDARRRRLVCVREDHTDPAREPVNTLVSIPLDGTDTAGSVIASGYDFYSTPRLSPDGSALAWIAWRHPQMPWDGTELWVAEVTRDGGLANPICVAGGTSESIYQPGWLPDGSLCFASDRDGWWKLYLVRLQADPTYVTSDPTSSRVVPVISNPPEHAEFGRPQWVFGTATWAAAGPARIIVAYANAGRWRLATVDTGSRLMTDLASDLEPHDWLTATSTHAILMAAAATTLDAVVTVDLATGGVETLRRSSTFELDPATVSRAEPISFRTHADGRTTHAFYYAPRNVNAGGSDEQDPPYERPPLIAMSHGGPTMATRATLDLKIQFWTSRGFAVVDVNYGGSSGYGRAYRERLNGQWGVVDVADTVTAARYLVEQGMADPDRLIIRGGSAGGYTTLAALTFYPDVFSAGASYYGISDIEALVRDTHKFESRYVDSLIGPYPAMRELYRARSPIHFVDRLACALILFQGLEDKAVPPSQSKMMADAVRAKGLPVAYLTFEGEQHGFRKGETIRRSLEAELFFYGAVFGFTPADALESVAIANL